MTRNEQDIIDDMRNIVKPRIAKMLLEANFEGCGKEDKAEFETEFEIILTLAEKALEQEPQTGHWTYICNSEVNGLKIVECSECGKRTYGSGKYCPHCGAKMVEPQESEDNE